MPSWWVGWISCRFLLVPWPSVFSYYSGIRLCDLKIDKARIRRISITGLLVFVLLLFVGAARDILSVLNTVDARIFAEGPTVLGTMPDNLARLIDELAFFLPIRKRVKCNDCEK